MSTLFFPSGCSAAGVPLSNILIINFLLILGRFLLPSGKSQAHRHRRQRAPTQTHPKLGELCSVTSRLGKILKLLQFKPPTLRLKSSNVRKRVSRWSNINRRLDDVTNKRGVFRSMMIVHTAKSGEREKEHKHKPRNIHRHTPRVTCVTEASAGHICSQLHGEKQKEERRRRQKNWGTNPGECTGFSKRVVVDDDVGKTMPWSGKMLQTRRRCGRD